MGFPSFNASRIAIDLTGYRDILSRIHEYLVSYDDRHWAPVVREWLVDLDHTQTRDGLLRHATMTRQATGGMGSLGDLAIDRTNGHAVPDDPADMAKASERLWEMTAALYREADEVVKALESRG